MCTHPARKLKWQTQGIFFSSVLSFILVEYWVRVLCTGIGGQRTAGGGSGSFLSHSSSNRYNQTITKVLVIWTQARALTKSSQATFTPEHDHLLHTYLSWEATIYRTQGWVPWMQLIFSSTEAYPQLYVMCYLPGASPELRLHTCQLR